MRHDNLAGWLAWLEQLHPRAIDLGLERVGAVGERLGVTRLPCPVITVAGTNGKGSTVAMLESILSAAGHVVACYTSPHLLRYNERVRVAGREADDAALCAAFARVDEARGDTSLSYFEFGTLAAFDLFARARPDVAILEVGLGGRLDAVNIIDPDVALVTSIGLDHTEWLGADRDAIGAEKAGIFRANLPAVCSDPSPPQGLLRVAAGCGARLHCLGREFGIEFPAAEAGGTEEWTWRGPGRRMDRLPPPGLAGEFQYRNAAGALMAIDLLSAALAVGDGAVREGLARASLPGRFQRLAGKVSRIFDVAHNVDGARALAANLAAMPAGGTTRAVFAALGDKDIDGMVSSMSGVIDEWHVAALTAIRAAPAERLRVAVAAWTAGDATAHPDIASAYRQALARSQPGDRVVVFGSFYTVGAALGLEQGAGLPHDA